LDSFGVCAEDATLDRWEEVSPSSFDPTDLEFVHALARFL
jgi:hypothetical protein